jgi:hypothetical protein
MWVPVPRGTFSTRFRVPQQPPGSYAVIAVGQASGQSASATFTVPPKHSRNSPQLDRCQQSILVETNSLQGKGYSNGGRTDVAG